jgi:hypothetical protein
VGPLRRPPAADPPGPARLPGGAPGGQAVGGKTPGAV